MPERLFPKLAATPQGEAALPMLLGKPRSVGRAWVLAVIWLAVGVGLGALTMAVPLTTAGVWLGVVGFAGSGICGAVAVAMVRFLVLDWTVARLGRVGGIIVFCVVLAAPVVVYGARSAQLNADLSRWLTSTPWLTLPLVGVCFMAGVAAIMVAISGIGELIGALTDRPPS